jgi:hypothetical protein
MACFKELSQRLAGGLRKVTGTSKYAQDRRSRQLDSTRDPRIMKQNC